MKLESEYERIYQAYHSVKRENARLRDDNNRLRIQVSAYIDSDAGQKREIGELQAEVDRLNEEAASLASQLAAQVAANETLRRTVAERDAAGIVLEWDIDALKRENAELRMEAAVRLRPVEAIPCGRFDDHEAHLWSDAGPDYQCPGYQD